MPKIHHQLQTFIATFLLVGSVFAQQRQPQEALPALIVVSAIESADGYTQAAFNIQLLKEFERKTATSVETKMRAYLKSQGDSTHLPNIKSETHYAQAGEMKIAIIRLKAKDTVNQVFTFGIVGEELRRVICSRTKNINEPISLFYGPCGEKIREVYGVSFQPK